MPPSLQNWCLQPAINTVMNPGVGDNSEGVCKECLCVCVSIVSGEEGGDSYYRGGGGGAFLYSRVCAICERVGNGCVFYRWQSASAGCLLRFGKDLYILQVGNM